jgi:Dockerin type I domain
MTTPEAIDSELNQLESRLGDGLRGELRSLEVETPADADSATRAVVRNRAAEIRRAALRSRRRYWPAWAAAAALLLGLGSWLALSSTRPPLRGDVDGSGRIDIVDAYLLARRLETQSKLEPHWDLSGDGKIDEGDVKAVAASAVSVSRR